MDALSLDSPPSEATVRRVLDDPHWVQLAPYLYWLTREADAEHLLPREPRLRLARKYLAVLANNTRLHQELARVIDAFGRAPGGAVEAIPLKGTVLAVRLYGDLGCRPTNDLDILVRPEDLGAAHDQLIALGYTAADLCSYHARYTCRLPEKRRGYTVELHWSLGYVAGRTRRLDELVWTRAVPVEDEGWRYHAMDPIDELLYLSLHLARHRCEFPHHALDVHLAARRLEHGDDPQRSWTELVERAAALNLLSHVALCFGHVEACFGIAPPEPIRPSLRVPWWKRRYFQRMYERGPRPKRKSRLPQAEQLSVLSDLLVLDETWRDRLDHLIWAAGLLPRSMLKRHSAARLLQR